MGKGNDNQLLLIMRALAIAVCTKNNNWNEEQYKTGVIEPCRKMKKMIEELKESGLKPTTEQTLEVLRMLKSVFITKGTAIEEQVDRFNQILDETGTIHIFKSFLLEVQQEGIVSGKEDK
ncbi:hypothetical protein [Clostridium sp. C8-1-8]|uniref:hypothetical protein n=1 Tax=Clostridium sp. C8-1-8 TaxID=2698831 RepID=UPI00136916D5|nr:hypothetical protein [Clostridium sp. C8-1-8]